MLNPVPLIDRKRRGESLSSEEIDSFVRSFVVGEVADYQMSAFAMAVCCRSMTAFETTSLTRAMLESGARFEWAPGPPVVDKHSTGGQGDKSSLLLAPILACLGFRVPMISGSGLGPTGGTLDKLSSIPGFRTDLTLDEIKTQVGSVGCVITGQSSNLCPADQQLYALRDATGTVASVPLITSSILCKKLAESLDALVLDVKFGAGAFMSSMEECRTLAESLVRTARELGLRATALLTSMEQPTGRMVGNALEVREAIQSLQNDGPPDLIELVAALATELLLAAKLAVDRESAQPMIQQVLDSGAAFEKFQAMVVAQRGDPDAPMAIARAADLVADRTGFVTSIDGAKVGYALIALGGGRVKTTDAIDPSVGFEFLVRIGDHVKTGQPLLRLFAARRGREEACALLRQAIVVADEPPKPSPLIVDRIA